MNDLIISFPWPETAISAGVGFVMGFIAGGWHGRRDRRSRA